MHRISLTLATLLALISIQRVGADPVHFLARNAGAYELSPIHAPTRIILTDSPTGAIEREPLGLSNPQYGLITLGPKESPGRFGVVVDGWDGGAPRLWIDRTGSGDLSSGCEVQLTSQAYEERDKKPYNMLVGFASISVRYAAVTVPVRLRIFRYDLSDQPRSLYRNSLLYDLDCGSAGTVQIGSRTLHAMLYDTTGLADYRGRPGGALLLLDVNDNGRFEVRGEAYDTAQPFNISGITYEVRNVSPSGDTFEIVRSKRHVDEILPPPDLRPGKAVAPFTAVDLSGAAVHFPSDYQGKVVLLLFYAAWCPDCRAEAPNLVSTYNRYHARGVEAIGVSLDKSDGRALLDEFTKTNGIPWRQVYDGGWRQAAVANLYMIQSIPSVIVVDGTTGTIIASGEEHTLGTHLADSIELGLRRLQAHQPK